LFAVEDADTAVKIPGMNPDADTNDITEPSTVLLTNVPVLPTYNPPATNPKVGLSGVALLNVEPEVNTTATPPTNCGLVTYEFCVSNFIFLFLFI
jgi:hypothetical protein